MKYFIYTRKSTESEDRQIMSIESQISLTSKIKGTDEAGTTDNLTGEEKSGNIGTDGRVAQLVRAFA